MKKILALIFAIALIAALGTTALAADLTITPRATVGGSPLTITATGLQDLWYEFDIGSIFGGGGGPYSYAVYFNSGGTISFNRAVTLTKTEVNMETFEMNTLERNVAAGETITVNAALNEYAIALDDDNSIIIVFGPDAGNYAPLVPDKAYSAFPGTVSDAGGGAPPPPPAGGGGGTGTPVRTSDNISVAIWTAVALVAVAGVIIITQRKKSSQ